MKNVFLFLILSALVFSCEKDDQFFADSSDSFEFRDKPDLIKACHFDKQSNTWIILDLRTEEIEFHSRHGDVFDMDNDGYFQKENNCQMPIDCDDYNNLVHSCAFCGYMDIMHFDKDAIYCDTNLKVSGTEPSYGAFETWISANYRCSGFRYVHVMVCNDSRGFYAASEVYDENEGLREKMLLSYDDAVNCRKMIQNIAYKLGLKNHANESVGRLQVPQLMGS